MVAQLLAHIATLETAVGILDEKIESLLAPQAKIVESQCTIPASPVRTAQVLIAECGLDMSRFPTVGHFASWAGICPGNTTQMGARSQDALAPGHGGRPRR